MKLSKKQVSEITKIIKVHTAALVHIMTGSGLTKKELDKMKAAGLIEMGVDTTAVGDSFMAGYLHTILDEAKLRGLDYEGLKGLAKDIPLSPVERGMIDHLQSRTAVYAKGLGNKVEADTLSIVHDAAQKASMKKIIEETLVEATMNREMRNRAVSDLRQKTKDWARDWHRIAHTEMWEARCKGATVSLGKRHGGGARVYRRPNPDACDICKAALLEGDLHTPKVFYLEELVDNGDSAGRDRMSIIHHPPVGTLHPYCQCSEPLIMPQGAEFDELGRPTFT
jgi:hypothetical protein